MEYCLVNLFIGCAIVLLWRVCFYSEDEGWRDAAQADVEKARRAVGGETEAVDMRGSSGKMLVGHYQRVLSGVAMPFP